MKLTRKKLRNLIREGLEQGSSAAARSIGVDLNNIPGRALRSVGGDFTKLAAEVNRSQEKIFVDIALAYMDQLISKLDQRYGLSQGQEHGPADAAKKRHQEMLSDATGLKSEIREAIKPFIALLNKYADHIEMG